MTDFIVHTIPGSPYGRTVLAALEEKGASWRIAPVTASKSAHLALHPFGKIPVLQQGNFVLYETQAIVRYLDRLFPQNPLTPADAQAAAWMDQFMGVNDWYLYLGGGATIGFERIVKPLLLNMPTDEANVAAAVPGAERALDVLARRLSEADYLAGADFSLADLMVGPQFELLSRTPEWAGLVAGRPAVAAYLERVEARPSFRATKWEQLLETLEAA